jgi:hypothetical protein
MRSKKTVNQNLTSVPASAGVRCEDSGETLPDNNGLEIARKIEQSIAYNMMEHLNQRLQVAILAAWTRVSRRISSRGSSAGPRRAPMDYFMRLPFAGCDIGQREGSCRDRGLRRSILLFPRVQAGESRSPSQYRTLQKITGRAQEPAPPLKNKKSYNRIVHSIKEEFCYV